MALLGTATRPNDWPMLCNSFDSLMHHCVFADGRVKNIGPFVYQPEAPEWEHDLDSVTRTFRISCLLFPSMTWAENTPLDLTGLNHGWW